MATKEDKVVIEQEAAAEREYQSKQAKDADPVVTPMHTPLEATTELRGYVYYAQQRLARGSKSDIDKIGPVLELIIMVLDEIMAEIPPPEVPLSARARDPLDAF